MSSPAYLMYPGDILSSGRVASLKPLEELWYRRAIDLGWEPCGMPADPAEFAGWVGRGCTVEAAEKIIKKFYKPHKKDTSLVVNERQEEERKKFIKKSKERSKAGIESGRKRRERRRLADEQLFNKTETKSNIPIPIPISISKEEIREEKKEETPQAASPKKGSRIPDEFLLTSEMRSWATERRPEIDPVLETEKFVNYWRAKSGRDAAKLDWRATWNNWILNAKVNGNGTNGTREHQNTKAIREWREFADNTKE